MIETVDVHVLEPVGCRVVANSGLFVDLIVEAERNINNDLVLSKAFGDAALNSGVNVDVPGSSSVHVVSPIPVLRRENSWD